MKKSFTLSLGMVLLLALTACSLPSGTSSSVEDLATQVAGTLQAMASATAALPTATETATQAPTATSAPAATNTPEAGRINLAAGATQAVVTGHVAANQTKSYLAGAAANQILIAELTTTGSGAVMEIVGADGTTLLPRTNQWTSFRSLLPKSQDYEIRIVGGSSDQDFTLVLTFAVPVKFASGADSADYSGQTVNGYPVTYAAYANKNQKLEVTVDTNPNDAALTVYGFDDGNPYARAQNGVTDFSLSLPSTQYYIIEVVPQGGRVIAYNLKIKVK